MKQLIDKNGNIINSHFRSNGSIVVKNESEYLKAKNAVVQAHKINDLQNQIESLNKLVNTLMESISKTNNHIQN